MKQLWAGKTPYVPTEYQFADKTVIVKGRPYTNSPMVQSVGGVHFELKEIRLADGETPHVNQTTSLPIPPKVHTLSEIETRRFLWVHCSGKIYDIKKENIGYTAKLNLSDGTPISFRLTRSSLHKSKLPKDISSWSELEVTVLGRVRSKGNFDLGLVRICEGIVDSCPIDDPQIKPSKTKLKPPKWLRCDLTRIHTRWTPNPSA